MLKQHLVRLTFLALAIVGVSLLHYHTVTSHLLLHQFFQRAYYLPILFAALWYGWRGGLLAAALSGVLYAPHILTAWHGSPTYSANQFIEIGMFLAIAVVTGVLADHERGQRKKVEDTAHRLADVYAQLQASSEQLRRADRLSALGQLSAGLAHELRNPLGAIQGAVRILRRPALTNELRQEFGELAEKEIDRLNDLVTVFLQFARPQTPQRVSTAPRQLLESVYRLGVETAKMRGVELQLEADADLPSLLIDHEQMKQVLLNLLINAIQASSPGGAIALHAKRVPEAVIIEVRDQGKGIEEGDLERIFDPFFTTRAEGTGLGLSIAYRIVSQHGGHISAARNPDRGMTFTVRLPVVSDEVDVDVPAGASA